MVADHPCPRRRWLRRGHSSPAGARDGLHATVQGPLEFVEALHAERLVFQDLSRPSDLLAKGGQRPVGLLARAHECVVPFSPGPRSLLLCRSLRFPGAGLGGLGPLGRRRGSLARLADAGQRGLELDLQPRQPRPGVLHELVWQPQALGDGEGVARARQADLEAVGRAEGLEVELDGCVASRRRVVGVGLQLGVMRRGHHESAGIHEVIEERLCQRRALRRVGARAELVEQDQAARARRLHDAHDRAHVA